MPRFHILPTASALAVCLAMALTASTACQPVYPDTLCFGHLVDTELEFQLLEHHSGSTYPLYEPNNPRPLEDGTMITSCGDIDEFGPNGSLSQITLTTLGALLNDPRHCDPMEVETSYTPPAFTDGELLFYGGGFEPSGASTQLVAYGELADGANDCDGHYVVYFTFYGAADDEMREAEAGVLPAWVLTRTFIPSGDCSGLGLHPETPYCSDSWAAELSLITPL